MASQEDTKIPITERANLVTSNIDIAEVNEIVELVQKAENEIFQEWYENEPGVINTSVLAKIDTLVKNLAELINKNSEDVKVIMSGCGTSGRLGFIASKKFNEICRKMNKPEIFDYLISGNDMALFKSIESVEDDAVLGKEYLREVTNGVKRWIFIGISCGLSASFVAGQTAYALEKYPECLTTVIGFNPVEMAKDRKVKNISFKDVAVKLNAEDEKGLLINPVIGAEPIAGSSRMKGGTATKIILDSMFLIAMAKCFGDENVDCKQVIETHKTSLELINEKKDKIANCIKEASESLLSNGHVYYIGLNSCGYYGILDASECVPTFGASYHDIRGFIKGGFNTIGNKEGDLSNDDFDVSLSHFEENILPKLCIDDYVIIYGDVSNAGEMQSLKRSVGEKKAKVTLMLLGSGDDVTTGQEDEFIWQTMKNDNNNIIIDIELNEKVFEDCRIQNELRLSIVELSLKRILNMISTGAYIKKGKILQNIMIDLKVSNDKLLNRAISIIMKFTNSQEKDAFESLLKALYQKDELTEDERNKDITYLIRIGSQADQVVPMAMLLATGLFTVESARNVLCEDKVVRKCLIERTKSQ